MKPQDSVPRGPLCHRCKRPMVFQLQEAVGDRQMHVFQCEFCDSLDAFEANKAA